MAGTGTDSRSRAAGTDEPEDVLATTVVGRGLSRRFELHALGLLAILLLLFPLAVGDTVWSADIGARLHQVQTIQQTGDWVSSHPLRAADPDGLFYPFHLSYATGVPYQYIVFDKHPLLVWMTTGLFQLGGLRALVVVNTFATFAASVGTARIVARTRPSLAVAALWFTGLLSPLFFDGYLGYAHSLAAALLVWAGVFALHFADPHPKKSAPDTLVLLASAVLVALAALLRTEAAFVGLAIAGATFVTGLRYWPRRRWVLLFLAIGPTALAAAVLDRLIKPATIGVANPRHATDPWGGLVGRFEGLQRTWLSPGSYPVDLLILFIAVLIFVVGLAGFNRSREQLAELLLALGLALAIARVILPEPILVFGLVMACPLLILGMVKGARLVGANAETLFCLATFVLFSGAVLITQYRFGGVAEWGGRYFAVGLPFAVAVAVPGLAIAVSQFSPRRSYRLIALAAGASLLINLGGIQSLVHSRSTTRALTNEVAESMATVNLLRSGPTDDDRGHGYRQAHLRPVVVSTVPAMARLAWDVVDRGSWLLVENEDLSPLADRLADLDVDHFTLVTGEADEDLAELEGHYVVESWETTVDTPLDVIILTSSGR